MRGVVRLSCNHGNILRSDCAFECLVVPKLIPSCTIGKADGGVILFLLPHSERDGDRGLPRQGLSCVPLGDSFADVGVTLH